MDKDYRGLLLEYDNIVQSIDYGYIDFMLHHTNWTENNLKYENLFRKMTPEETTIFLNERNESDLFVFLSKTNKKTIELDANQYSEEYFKDIQISKFAEGLPVLISSGSINKLFIAVDKKNKYKLNVILYLLKEYKKEIIIVDNNEIPKYLIDNRINSVFLNEDTAFRNIDKLKNKAIMINDTGYIYDYFKVDGEDVKITKNRWEERTYLDISFIKPFKYPIKRFASIEGKLSLS